MLHVIYFISKFDIITETWSSDYEKCIVLPFVIFKNCNRVVVFERPCEDHVEMQVSIIQRLFSDANT